MASCIAKPKPVPICFVAEDNMVSFAGERMALPIRSNIINTLITCQVVDMPISGTVIKRKYPIIVKVQYPFDLSAK